MEGQLGTGVFPKSALFGNASGGLPDRHRRRLLPRFQAFADIWVKKPTYWRTASMSQRGDCCMVRLAGRAGVDPAICHLGGYFV
jgi:hypothetical protein